MDSELILQETMTEDDIEPSLISPLISLLTYLVLFVVFVNMGTNDYIMFLLCSIITMLLIDTYRRDFLELLSELYY
jgi:hypothetical protein